MSQRDALGIKEYDDQYLGDVEPTMAALIRFLTIENGGARMEETRTAQLPNGTTVHEMSNGLCYALDGDNRWYVVLD